MKLKLSRLNGDVVVYAIEDETNPRPGAQWMIVAITSRGRLRRYRSIPNDIGFQVDAEGRVLAT